MARRSPPLAPSCLTPGCDLCGGECACSHDHDSCCASQRRGAREESDATTSVGDQSQLSAEDLEGDGWSELVDLRRAVDEPSIWPIPQVPRPRRGSLRCSGSRKHHRTKLEVWKVAASMVNLLNGLDEGTFRQQTPRGPWFATDMRPQGVVGSIHAGIQPEAKRFVERRRGFAPTGVLAVARLL